MGEDEIDWALVDDVLAFLDNRSEDLPRHRHSLSRGEVERRQCGRILAATALVVAERGYDATTVSAITSRAGVSSKTFYARFRDKEESFLGLYVALDASVELLRQRVADVATLEELIDLGASAYLATLSVQPVLARVLTVEALGASRTIALRRIQALNNYVDAMGESTARVGRDIPRPRLMAFVGATNELVYQQMVTGVPAQIADVEPVLRDLASRIFSD